MAANATAPPPLDDAALYYLSTRDDVWVGYYVLAFCTLSSPFLLLRHYSNPLSNPLVIAMCGIGWGISVAMIVLAPLDLSGTYHQRCLHTELEWAGQFELQNATYSWVLEPAEHGEYSEQQMYAALLPWAAGQPLWPDVFEAVRSPPYKTCTDEDVCATWLPAPTSSAPGSVLSPGKVYELNMAAAPASSTFHFQVPISGSYALVTVYDIFVNSDGFCI